MPTTLIKITKYLFLTYPSPTPQQCPLPIHYAPANAPYPIPRTTRHLTHPQRPIKALTQGPIKLPLTSKPHPYTPTIFPCPQGPTNAPYPFPRPHQCPLNALMHLQSPTNAPCPHHCPLPIHKAQSMPLPVIKVPTN